jgi:hypothetical protein
MSIHEWEFLMQKEGDQDWLSLEAPTAEILEGRYRLMAQSQFSDTSIDIQIRHICEQDGIPKRLMQRRSHTSNPEGLVGVIPYTYLQPGLWKFSCRAGSGNSSSGNSSPDANLPMELGSVQLLVHPHSALLDTEWQPEAPLATGQSEAIPPEQVALDPISFDRSENQTLGMPQPEQGAPILADLSDDIPGATEIEDLGTANLEVGDITLAELALEPPSLVINLDLDLNDTILPWSPATATPLPSDLNSVEPSPAEPNLDNISENAIELAEVTEPELQRPMAANAEDVIEQWSNPTALESAELEPAASKSVTSEPTASEPDPNLISTYSLTDLQPAEEVAELLMPWDHQHSTLLTLDCHAFTTSPGQMVTLTGQVMLPCDLIIQLRDPWNYQLVWQEHLSLQSQTGSLPWRFTCELMPPATGTLVGEVKMIVVGTGQPDALRPDAAGDLRQTQTFMITVVEATTTTHPSAPKLPSPEVESPKSSDAQEAREPVGEHPAPQPGRITVVRLPVFDRDIPPLMFQVSQGMTLPPQLHQNRVTVKKDLELPEFPKLGELPLAEQLLPEVEEEVQDFQEFDSPDDAPVNPVAQSSFTPTPSTEPDPATADNPYDIPVAGRIIDRQIYGHLEHPPEQTSDMLSFEALQFKRRFLNILRALAQKKGNISTIMGDVTGLTPPPRTAAIPEDHQSIPAESPELQQSGLDSPTVNPKDVEALEQLVTVAATRPDHRPPPQSADTDPNLSLPDFL